MRTIIWYIHLVISTLAKTPEMYSLKRRRGRMEPAEFERAAQKSIAGWARSQAEWSGSRIVVTGDGHIPQNQAVLFISNHQSNFDIVVFLGYVGTAAKGFIAKAEIEKLPLVPTWMGFINCVFIDRENMRKSAEAVLKGIEMLKNGKSMVLFPEGTRSKGAQMGEFKKASFKLATKSGACVVPVTIDGTYKIMEANGMRIRPADVAVTIHEPIFVRDMTKEELAALPKRVEEIIGSALLQKI